MHHGSKIKGISGHGIAWVVGVGRDGVSVAADQKIDIHCGAHRTSWGDCMAVHEISA